MHLLFVNQEFGERIIQALCWTLVHSLWQGLLLTMVTGLVILFTRRSGASVRYSLFSGAALLFLLGACCTFAWQWERSAGPAPAGSPVMMLTNTLPTTVTGNEVIANVEPSMPAYQDFSNRLVNYFNEHASLIVTIWFIIFSARLVKILANLGAMQRIRHYRTHVPPAWWKERLQELAGLLHIKKQVNLLESELIKVPVMAGIFKPVILLPFSLMSQLPAEQVEAILLHELAHIRRRDYVVNLIQSFAEILFFFNPGVLWISSLIREERENCCDDIAVGLTGNKKELIHALVSFQEYNDKAHVSAMAFPGSGNHLLQRVKRILYHDNKILDIREKFFLVCSLLVTAALILAFSGASRQDRQSRVAPQQDRYARVPATPVKHTTMPGGSMMADRSKIPGRSMVSEKLHGTGLAAGIGRPAVLQKRDTLPPVPPVPPAAKEQSIVPASPDTSVVPAKTIHPATATEPVPPVNEPVAPMKKKTRLTREAPVSPILPKKAVTDRPNYPADEQEYKQEAQKWKEENLKMEKLKTEKWMEEKLKDEKLKGDGAQKWKTEELEMKEQQLKRKMTEQEWEKRYREQQAAMEKQERMLSEEQRKLETAERDLYEQSRKLAVQQKMMALENAENFSRTAQGNKFMAEPGRDTAFRPFEPKQGWKRPVMNTNQKFIAPIIADLFSAKLIDNAEELSFSLNAQSLIVNGVTEPEEVFQRFKDKYIKDSRNELKYSRKKDGSESTTINVH